MTTKLALPTLQRTRVADVVQEAATYGRQITQQHLRLVVPSMPCRAATAIAKRKETQQHTHTQNDSTEKQREVRKPLPCDCARTRSSLCCHASIVARKKAQCHAAAPIT